MVEPTRAETAPPLLSYCNLLLDPSTVNFRERSMALHARAPKPNNPPYASTQALQHGHKPHHPARAT